MLADKRHSMILGIVNDEGSATVGDLAERIGISESTIRRDLAQLADAGKLNKVHGGAVALDAEDVQHDVPVAERSAKNVAQKRAIAQAAALSAAGRGAVKVLSTARSKPPPRRRSSFSR